VGFRQTETPCSDVALIGFCGCLLIFRKFEEPTFASFGAFISDVTTVSRKHGVLFVARANEQRRCNATAFRSLSLSTLGSVAFSSAHATTMDVGVWSNGTARTQHVFAHFSSADVES